LQVWYVQNLYNCAWGQFLPKKDKIQHYVNAALLVKGVGPAQVPKLPFRQ
jgi:hypothetical protein